MYMVKVYGVLSIWFHVASCYGCGSLNQGGTICMNSAIVNSVLMKKMDNNAKLIIAILGKYAYSILY